MCAPCIVIINGCGVGNNAATSFINANEQFAEAMRYMIDNGTISEEDIALATAHCEGYKAIAQTIDAFTKKTLDLAEAIAKRTKNPHAK